VLLAQLIEGIASKLCSELRVRCPLPRNLLSIDWWKKDAQMPTSAASKR